MDDKVVGQQPLVLMGSRVEDNSREDIRGVLVDHGLTNEPRTDGHDLEPTMVTIAWAEGMDSSYLYQLSNALSDFAVEEMVLVQSDQDCDNLTHDVGLCIINSTMT